MFTLDGCVYQGLKRASSSLLQRLDTVTARVVELSALPHLDSLPRTEAAQLIWHLNRTSRGDANFVCIVVECLRAEQATARFTTPTFTDRQSVIKLHRNMADKLQYDSTGPLLKLRQAAKPPN